MIPRIFQIINTESEVVAHGCVFNSGKCIMEWYGSNPLLMIWGSFEEMDVVSKIMKAKIVFL